MPNVFIKRYWGFHPEVWPFIAFGKQSSRDHLAEKSKPGDLIVFVGTQGKETRRPEDRGRIMGMATFGQKRINTPEKLLQEINPSFSRSDTRAFDKHGNFKWPYALPMLRAWRFTNPPLLKDIMAQLPPAARHSAVLLPNEDKDKILSLSSIEVELPPAIQTFRDLNSGVSNPSHNPTTGPQPSSGTWNITHTSATEPAVTYALQFGSHDLWKIGLARDPTKRMRDINTHIPHEILGEQWELILTQRWPTGAIAYKMEQVVLRLLEKYRTTGERVRCSRKELDAAWKSAYLEIT